MTPESSVSVMKRILESWASLIAPQSSEHYYLLILQCQCCLLIHRSSLLYYELSTGDWRELEMVDVPPEGNYYCNPTFSPDGSKLLFLQCPAFGTHKKALDLVMVRRQAFSLSSHFIFIFLIDELEH